MLAVRQKASTAATVDECAGVARVVQYLDDPRMPRLDPMQLTFFHPLANATREAQPLLVKQFHGFAWLTRSARRSRRPAEWPLVPRRLDQESERHRPGRQGQRVAASQAHRGEPC